MVLCVVGRELVDPPMQADYVVQDLLERLDGELYLLHAEKLRREWEPAHPRPSKRGPISPLPVAGTGTHGGLGEHLSLKTCSVDVAVLVEHCHMASFV